TPCRARASGSGRRQRAWRRPTPVPPEVHPAGRVGGEGAVARLGAGDREQLGEVGNLLTELIELVLHLEDAPDALQVDAFGLAQVLHPSEPLHVPGRWEG